MSVTRFEEFLWCVEAPALRAVALHWQAARASRRMPSWRDIDATAIAAYLPIVWSWKYDRAADAMTGRLAGEEINALFGKSLRGVVMEEFFRGHDYEMVFARHRRVVVEPALMHGSGVVFIHVGRRGLGERIIMPLADDGETGDSIIGATIYQWVSSDRGRPASPNEPRREAEEFFPLD
ncbi:MAG: hypothetical protein JWL84_2607 [Rhodospirillales bacterium]|nr:hypothetical protein [Rhodospirillales bacterium]